MAITYLDDEPTTEATPAPPTESPAPLSFSDVINNTYEAAKETGVGLIKGIVQLPRYAFEGAKVAAGVTRPLEAFEDIAKEAIPMGQAMSQGLQSQPGSKEWIGSLMQAGLFALPGLELVRGAKAPLGGVLDKPPVQAEVAPVLEAPAEVLAKAEEIKPVEGVKNAEQITETAQPNVDVLNPEGAKTGIGEVSADVSSEGVQARGQGAKVQEGEPVPGAAPSGSEPAVAPEARQLTFTEEQNQSANLSRQAEGERGLRPKAQIEESVGLRPISEVNQTIDTVRKNMVTKEQAFTEKLRGMQEGSEIGAASTRKNLRMADKWLEADRDAIRTDLLDFSKNLPLNERAKFLPAITSALKRPSITTKDPQMMYRRAEDVMQRMTEKVYDVHRKERIGAIEGLIERVEASPSITVSEKQAIRNRANTFNNLKEKMSPSMLDNMHASMAETERMGRDLYILGDVIQSERAAATLREIAQQGVRKIDKPEQTRPVLGEIETYWDNKMNQIRQGKGTVKNANLAIDPIDWLIEGFDGKPEGALYRTLRVPSDVKWGEHANLSDAYTDRLVQIQNKYKLNQGNARRIQAHAELRQEGGLENLKELGYTDKEINSVKTLTRPELEWLREFDSIAKETHPMAREVLKEHFNQELPEIQGYFPRQIDRNLYDSLSIEEGRLAQAFNRTKTKASSTMERTPGAVIKGKTDAFEIAAHHIQDLMYHIKVGPEVARIAKVVKSEEFKNLVGEEGQKQFADWTDVLSRNGGVAAGRRSRAIDLITKGVGVGQLAYRLSTIFLQPMSIIPAMGLVSPKNVGVALSNFAKSENRAFILKNMPEIRKRFGDDPAMYGYAGKSIRDKAARAGFKPIGELDRFAAMIVGEAAYRDNLAKRGIPFDINKPDPTAIQYAQYTMRKTQSSPLAKDVPLASSKGNLTGYVSVDKALLQFQNYILGRWGYFKHGALQLGIKEKNPKTAARIFGFLILGTIAEQMGRDGLKRLQQALLGTTPGQEQQAKKDAKAGKGYARQIAEKAAIDFATSAPGLTNLRGVIQYEGSGIPAVDVLGNIGIEGAKVFTGTKPETRIAGGIRAVQGLGSAAGLPTSQAGDIAVQAVKANIRTKPKSKKEKTGLE